MKYTQNAKILQVTNETIIVGVDIAIDGELAGETRRGDKGMSLVG